MPEMVRFDDGMANVAELVFIMAQPLVNEIMDAQADEACASGNARNGCAYSSAGRTSCGSFQARGLSSGSWVRFFPMRMSGVPGGSGSTTRR